MRMVKQLTGAQVMAMAEDVPALKAIKPGGKEHPIDRIMHDGDTVTLGGTTLVAHLTAGPHARLHDVDDEGAGRRQGRTTWCSTAACARRATSRRRIVDEFNRSFKVVRALPCDVPLGDHPARSTTMQEKYAKLRPAVRIRSSTRRTATSKRTSWRRCSARRSPSSSRRGRRSRSPRRAMTFACR